jgi:hypothetical protein
MTTKANKEATVQQIIRDASALRDARERIREKLFCTCGHNMNAHRLDYRSGNWLLCLPEKGCAGFRSPADAAYEAWLESQKQGSAA